MIPDPIKTLLKRSPLAGPLRSLAMTLRLRRAHSEWLSQGKPIPPPHAIKQRTLWMLARRFRTRIFVETGTYRGNMLEALKYRFDQLYSIELSQPLHEAARQRFQGDRQIRLLQGDSGEVLPTVIAELQEPALFWLDGHYSEGVTAKGSKETPIQEELEHIFGSKVSGHVVVIDDARCFGSEPDYPTLEQVRDLAAKHSYDYSVEADSIRLIPRRSQTRPA